MLEKKLTWRQTINFNLLRRLYAARVRIHLAWTTSGRECVQNTNHMTTGSIQLTENKAKYVRSLCSIGESHAGQIIFCSLHFMVTRMLEHIEQRICVCESVGCSFYYSKLTKHLQNCKRQILTWVRSLCLLLVIRWLAVNWCHLNNLNKLD